jgi:hypothetical protein
VKSASPSSFKIYFVSLIVLFACHANAWNTPNIKSLGNKFTKYTWTGNGFATNLNWSNPANWCGTYQDGACRGASTAPAATDVVIFDDVCGAHCNANIDANVTIEAIMMMSTYTGTITQNTFNVTVTGAFGNAWSQAAGTFQGGSGTLTIGGAVAQKFTLSGGNLIGGSGAISIGSTTNSDNAVFSGGNFTASSTTTSIKSPADFRGLNSFTHNGGLVLFRTGTAPANGFWFTGNAMIFNDVKFDGPTSSLNQLNATTLVMDGNLYLYGAALSTVQYNNGTVELRVGNVIRGGASFIGSLVTKFTGTGLQTIDMTATTVTSYPGIWVAQTAITGSFKVIGTTITMYGGFLTTGDLGTIAHNSVAYGFYSINTTPAANGYDTQGYVTFPNLTLGGNTIRLAIGTVKAVDLIVDGNGSANDSNGAGVVEISGNVSFTAGGQYQGNVKFLFNGAGAQVVDCTGAAICGLPYVEVNKGAPALSFVGTPQFHAGFNYIAGGFTPPTTAQFSWGSGAISASITSNGIIWNNVIIGGTYNATHSITFNDILKVSGNLTIGNANSNNKTLVGTIEVTGNMNCSANATGLRWTAAGNGWIKMVGANPTIDFSVCNAAPSGGGTIVLPQLEIAVSGTASTSSTFIFTQYKLTSGAANFIGSTISANIASGTTFAPGATEWGNLSFPLAGSFTLSGTAKINGNLNLTIGGGGTVITGGTFDVYGNVTAGGFGFSGTVTQILHGNDSTYSRTSTIFPSGTITVAKNAGKTVTLASNVTLNNNQSINVTSGNIDIGSAAQTLTLSGTGNITLAAGTTVALSGGTLMIGGSSVPAGPYSGGTITP